MAGLCEKYNVVWLWLLLALSSIQRAVGAYTISVLGSPSSCFGGEPCLVQPSVGVYDDGVIDIGFSGYAYANIETSPSGLEALWIGECDIDDNCGTRVSGNIANTYFSNGIATFSDIMVKTAGEGYSLKITLSDFNGNDLAFTYSSTFTVSVGALFKMDFAQTVGAGTGGSAFSPNPIVALTDRGSNAVLGETGSTVSVIEAGYLVDLYPEAATTVVVENGFASFEGLYINEAGGPYTLRFITSAVDSSGTLIPDIYSSSFLVSVGPAHQMVFAPNASVELATITAGEFFIVTPRIYIQDAGGNTLVDDDESAVTASISDNPSDATLGLESQLFEVAVGGIATFTTLTIDKTGQQYRLAFVYSSYDSDTSIYTASTDIILYSERFDVELGLGASLETSVASSNAWAGGSPFGVQPELLFKDRGGNVITTDFDSTVVATVVSSLINSAIITLDTTVNDETFVTNITSSVSESHKWWSDYGAGDQIVITLQFNFEVWLTIGTISPVLTLNVQDSGGANVEAVFSGDITRATTTLLFNYTVGVGDTMAGNVAIDAASTTALDIKGGTLVNANGEAVSLVLPVGSSNAGALYQEDLTVNTAAPVAINVTTDTETGEYGVGELIEFLVLFDSPVVATGSPFIELNAINVNTESHCKAVYSGTVANSSDHILIFAYTVTEGDTSATNDRFQQAKSDHLEIRNETIYYDSASSSIKRLSDIPTTAINPSLASFRSMFNAQVNITVDTSVPVLDTAYGIVPRAANASETIYPGDSIAIYVKFNKQIYIANDAITLTLECTSFYCYAQFAELLPDEQTMRFSLTVPQSASSSDLDIVNTGTALLSSAQLTYIKRKATTPTQNVDASTTAIYSSNSLAANGDIVVAGNAATLSHLTTHNMYMDWAVAPNAEHPRTMFVDDTVVIGVHFTHPVILTCTPVFVVQLEGKTREATYAQGNLSDTIYFNYTAKIGDIANSLQYRYSPNAFCLQTGCVTSTACTAKIYSEVPTQSVSTTMPTVDSSTATSAGGIVFNATVSVNGTSLEQLRPTTITSITSRYDNEVNLYGEYDDPAGEYGAGNTIYFDVNFLDEVVWPVGSTTLPKLWLSIGKWAVYSSGFGTDKLTFTYALTESDDTTSLIPTDLSVSESPIYCQSSDLCYIYNRNQRPVDLSPGPIVDPQIVVDTKPPYIEWVWTNKTTSPYDGVYTTGEEIIVNVRWSKPISISGRNPRLVMDVTGDPEDLRYAILDETLTAAEGDHIMVFKYTVAAGSYSDDLKCVGPEIEQYYGLSSIYRQAGTLTTEANYTLPYPNTPLPLADTSAGQVVKIDTTLTPSVESVQWVTEAGTYYPGDTLLLMVTMTRYVVLDGRATIKLRVGTVSLENAVYVGCQEDNLDLDTTSAVSNADLLPSNVTKTLYFAFILKAGLYQPKIDYVDSYSFDLGLTDLGNDGTLKAASTTPTLNSIIDLPVPGMINSLSTTYTLNAPDGYSGDEYVGVNGNVPYMNSLRYTSTTGEYYAGDKVYITMGFTADVVVTGTPSIIMYPDVEGTQRQATYISGSGTSTMTFLYVVQPGDQAAENGLDYYADRANLNSAVESFLYNGGSIKLMSDDPVVDASVWLNPPGGRIRGTTTATATAGVVSYLDLAIKRRGFDYNVIFKSYQASANRDLSTSQVVFVSFSNEFELRADEGIVDDLGGASVAITGDYAVVGAPGSNVTVPTIQTVTSQSTNPFLVPTECIQQIGTQVERLPAIQTWHSTGDVGTVLAGNFRIYHENHAGGLPSAMTRSIPINANEGMLEAIIEADLPHLGEVEVSRQAYIYCACENAFTWSITFTELTEGYVQNLVFDTSGLTSDGADITDLVRVQEAGIVGGHFVLHANQRTTEPIPHNASSNDIKQAMIELDLVASNVQVHKPDALNHRDILTWQVTFEAYQHSYDIPLLTSTYTDTLTGNSAKTWHQMIRRGIHGPGGLNGNFTLTFRENTTSPILYDATASEMKAALEELPTINYVNVERSDASAINGFTWEVEFVSINYNTARGYFEEVVSNVEPLTVTNLLIGTDTEVAIGTRYAMESFNPATDKARPGTFGASAGAAYLYERNGEEWTQVLMLHGNDTDELDHFGESSGIGRNGDVVIIGAPSADMNGLYEIQSISCSARSGTFQLSYRGWTTPEIAFDVTADELQAAIISDLNDFDVGLYGVTKVEVKPFTGSFCGNDVTAEITFYSPLDAAYNLTGHTNSFPDLKEITPVVGTLLMSDGTTPGTLTVAEVRKGTTKVHDTGSNRQQHGAAYVFRANCSVTAENCGVRSWEQEAQLFPIPEPGTSGDMFGSRVVVNMEGTIAVVGAPGGENSRGHVYIYQYQDDDADGEYRWELFQRILVEDTVDGDLLGSSLAIYGNTIAFGAPKFSGTGALFVYKRSQWGEVYKLSQTAKPNLMVYPLAAGDDYGSSVAISELYMAVGAPGRDDAAIWKGRTTNTEESNTGAVFVFSRRTTEYIFVFLQKLEATNVRRLDRFGYSLATDYHSIVVGSLESFNGAFRGAKTVISITTSATYNANPVGATFKLKWEYQESSLGIMGKVRQTTRDISHATTAAEMEEILEKDLSIGRVIVSRSNVDVYCNGYQWLVTFQEQTGRVPLFEADTSNLAGTNPMVTIQYSNEHTEEVRGKAHVFTLASIESNQASEGYFVEQGFLFPYSHQSNDQCGASVAISEMFALVGCPNRDENVPNNNAGSAGVYSLNILNTAFTSSTYEITEGETLELPVVRREGVFTTWNSSDALLYVDTLDRNSVAATQASLQNLFGLADGDIPIMSTAVDESHTAGTAIGRSQFYGSTHNESQWVGGMYDYRGISDYVPFSSANAFLVEYDNITQDLVSTPDSIVEAPNENISVILHAPGFWPSVMGDLFSMVTINDNSDGVYSSVAQYSKLYEDDAVSGGKLGVSVSACEDCKYIVSGCPESSGVGQAVIYRFSSASGAYEQEEVIASPTPTDGMRYGDGVAISPGFFDNTAKLAIGEPNAMQVHVYQHPDYTDSSKTFIYEATLTSPEVSLRQHRFGAKGTIGLDRNLLVVGAPGLEAIFVYYRERNSYTGVWNWTDATMLRSSEFDYDVLWTITKLHGQEFGTSVAVSGRTIAVGAPFADYDKEGTDLVEENIDTEGPDIKGYGRGKVYMFYSRPAEEVIRYTSTSSLTAGEWKLRYENYGTQETTGSLTFAVTAASVQTALELLTNVESVSVTKSTIVKSDSTYEYSFTVTFLSDFGTGHPAGKLEPVWNGAAASNHDATLAAFIPQNSDPTTQMYTDTSASLSMTDVIEQQIIVTSDQRNGNRFGAAVALDGDQLVASAVYSAGATMTTWDFETGQLTGWGVTGTAFDYQPTYGDNSYLRPIYEPEDEFTGIRADSEGSRMKGRYYIGTYEMRPGSATDYTVADASHSQGGSQGDEPVGTLTSEVFMVGGDRITFLIGGGCDIYSIYVELLVDGNSVAKHTGKCTEKMDQVAFDTSLFHGRAAQIRIVDDNTAKWGHINVDQFDFDWDISGSESSLGNQAYTVGGKTETPRTGVVFAFHLTQYDTTISYDLCTGNKFDCVWTEEAKLIASDKRAHTFFGDSLSVNDELGIILVGSPYSDYTGFYKETPTLYPYIDGDDAADVTLVEFPADARHMARFQSKDSMAPESSGAYGVWYLSDLSNAPDYSGYYEDSGAVYVFTKEHAVASANGIDVPQRWSLTEKVKLQSPAGNARDYFGSAVSISGTTVAIGAQGDDGQQPDAGAVHLYHAGFASAYFSADMFSALEGTDADVTVYVSRDPDIYDGELVLEYATSDLTATGVDATKFTECLGIASNLRGISGCGDYQQTTGQLIIPVGSNEAGFKVKIMNDLCYERFLKFVQVTLSVPGSSALQGETLLAKVRIDDDDFLEDECAS
jgi:hypothetical protein